MAIRGMQLKRVVDAIVEAFPSDAKLKQFLQFRFERNLEALVGSSGGLFDRVFALFTEHATPEGWDLELVTAARASNPGNAKLLAVAQELSLAPALSPQFQAWVAPANGIHDAGAWYGKLGQVLARVGQVELDGAPAGTGFLVGPDLVLTNQHVIARAHRSLAVRFDYRSAGGHVSPGVVAKVVEIVDQSPPAAHDLEALPAALPTADELDHALLRLATPPGEEPFARRPIGNNPEPNAAPRGWLAPHDATFTAGTPLFIVQHPMGKPVSIAVDTSGVLGANAAGTRVRYRTNTEPGSSGSPCFDQTWNLIALHHVGDPSWGGATFNQGIPITMIAARLARVKGLTLPPPEA